MLCPCLGLEGEDPGANDNKSPPPFSLLPMVQKVNEGEGDYNGEKWTTQPRGQAQLVWAFPSVSDRLMPSVPTSCS